MTPYQVVWNLPIAAVAISLLLLMLGVFLRKGQWVLVAATLILVNANITPVSAITANLGFGFGSAWILMAILIILLTMAYRINPVKVFFPFISWPSLFLILTICYIGLISPIVSIDRAESVRASLSYLLVCILGWNVFGWIFAQRPGLTRARIYRMIYASGVWYILMAIAMLVLIGPVTVRSGITDLRSVITIGPYRVMRLQTSFLRATGLSQMAASSILVLIHLRRVWGRSLFRRILLMIALAVVGIVFIWSAGRTAMLSFAGTVASLLILTMVIRGGKQRFKTAILGLLLIIAVVLLADNLSGLFFRRGEGSVIEVFMTSRIDLALRGITAYKSHLTWGAGTGILLASFSKGDIAVESFFFRVLIELGAIGGTLYVITWLMLTYYVIRVDLYYMRRGHPAAWLPSSGFILSWIASPASFGFSIFTGSLALQLAIAAGAVVEWKRIKAAEQHPASLKLENRTGDQYVRQSV
jgi:hypothetical protein